MKYTNSVRYTNKIYCVQHVTSQFTCHLRENEYKTGRQRRRLWSARYRFSAPESETKKARNSAYVMHFPVFRSVISAWRFVPPFVHRCVESRRGDAQVRKSVDFAFILVYQKPQKWNSIIAIAQRTTAALPHGAVRCWEGCSAHLKRRDQGTRKAPEVPWIRQFKPKNLRALFSRMSSRCCAV